MTIGATALAATAADDRIDIELAEGVPECLDRLAASLDPDHAFLRAAWFRAGGADSTVVASAADGTPLAAFPTAAAGPAPFGARAVVGAYWPFRTVPLSPGLDDGQLVRLLADRPVRAALGPLWRMGPFYEDDPAGHRLLQAAPRAGWTVLTRRLGRTFLIDAGPLLDQGPWPRPSSLRKVRALERRLGDVRYERVEGAAWSKGKFDALAAVEQASWIADGTDASGAKFINRAHRGFWETAVRDPVLGRMFSALILWLGERPIAFCFDLNVGRCQYSIAATFDSAFAACSPGKLATYRGIEWALERGITRLDWGAGDSGYKRNFGAVQGPRILDCLFVRSPFVAAMVRPRWEGAAGAREGEDARLLPLGRREWLLLASLATAAAAGTLVE